jgi:hypothetical protein
MTRIGLKSIASTILASELNLKQDILIFDKLIIQNDSLQFGRQLLDYYFNFFSHVTGIKKQKAQYENNLEDIELLGKQGLLQISNEKKINIQIHRQTPEGKYEPNHDGQSLAMEFATIYDAMSKFKGPIKNQEELSRLVSLHEISADLSVRLRWFEQLTKVNTESYHFPILLSTNTLGNVPPEKDKQEPILRILLQNIPQPDHTVSWDHILEFKADPSTRAKYYALINWVNDISKTVMTASEIEERLQYLLHDYKEQYRIHKLKQKAGKIELCVCGIVGIVENLVKLKWSEIAKTFFNLHREELHFLEAETKFRGREVAYIHAAQEKFG